MTKQTGPSAAVMEAMSESAPAPKNSDSLAELQKLAKASIVLAAEISDLEEQLRGKNEALAAIYTKSMVDLMAELEIDYIGIPPTDNLPGMDFNLRSTYGANIAASWDAERKNRGFAFMKKMGAEDLIKTEVSVLFPKGGLQQAQKLLASAKKIKVSFKDPKRKKILKTAVNADLIKTIPSGSLKGWLKELYEKKGKTLTESQLALIGGYVGKVVKPEVRDAES